MRTHYCHRTYVTDTGLPRLHFLGTRLLAVLLNRFARARFKRQNKGHSMRCLAQLVQRVYLKSKLRWSPFVKDLGGLTSLRLREYATMHAQCAGGFKGHRVHETRSHLATPTNIKCRSRVSPQSMSVK